MSIHMRSLLWTLLVILIFFATEVLLGFLVLRMR